MRSRIQVLQRGGFPRADKVGRGARAIYDVDATFQLVVAFELAALGLPAQAATRLVEAFWPQLRALVDEGLGAAARNADPVARYAVIVPDALAVVRAEPSAARAESVSGETLAQWSLRVTRPTAGAYLLLDVVGAARRAAPLLRERVDGAEQEEENAA